jgi:hypothetical protein
MCYLMQELCGKIIFVKSAHFPRKLVIDRKNSGHNIDPLIGWNFAILEKNIQSFSSGNFPFLWAETERIIFQLRGLVVTKLEQ